MTISAVYIVRNSETTIRQSINCALKFCDEIIIVDTGSNDNTINEVMSCKSDKIRIENFKWVDDFSKARNYAMQFATCDYILVVDSDEMLNRLEIKEEADYYMAGIVNKRKDAFIGKEIFITNYNPRLFKRELNPFYEGLLHENVSTWRSDKKQGLANIEFVHVGYDDEKVFSKKIERNLAIALKQMEEQPNNLNNAYNLFKLYYEIKDYSTALDYAFMALHQPLNEQTKITICFLLYKLYFDTDKMYFAFFYLSMSLTLAPNQVKGNICLIEYFLYTKQYEKIDVVLNKIESVIENKSSQIEIDFYYTKNDFNIFKQKIKQLTNVN